MFGRYYLKIYTKTWKTKINVGKIKKILYPKMAKIEQKTQTFIANPELSLRIRNLRRIAFESQDSKDHFRYLTFWARIFKYFFSVLFFFLSFLRRVKNVEVELQAKVEPGSSLRSRPTQLWLEVQLERFSLVGEKNKNLYSDQVSFIILSAEISYNIDKKGQLRPILADNFWRSSTTTNPVSGTCMS